MAAKSRVAPIEKRRGNLTIPRLELLAATIGARLYTQVVENLTGSFASFFWSDSATVISWLQRNEEWGTCNPADLSSRGCSSKQLVESKWWEGPAWLYNNVESWPSTNLIVNEEEVNKENKRKVTTFINLEKEKVDFYLTYFSKYTKTLIQQEEFEGLKDNKLKNLSPYYDSEGVIRLKSRVSNRRVTVDYRYPVIMTGRNPIICRLIMEKHQKSCHVGVQGLLCLLRESYWIIGGRRAIRSVLKKCVTCKRFDVKPFAVESPPLPGDRVRDSAPFEITGVDFAGPLYLKSGEKAWVCLFTCAVYRAVHLELTMSLSTLKFLQVLRRFIARRGRPRILYSDNGTNFRGTDNAFANLDWDAITRETNTQRILWRFNPPSAPWWGGSFERLVGVVKRLLRKVLGKASLGYEDLMTLLCDCEAVVNARPLTYISNDHNDSVTLSPAMFLREQVSCNVVDCDLVEKICLTRSMRNKQKLREYLKNRFRLEYLGQLKPLRETKSNATIKTGDIVLIGNDSHKRVEWPMGQVIDVVPGKDGRIRLVRVRTSHGELLRPVQRLYPLECVDDSVERNHNDRRDVAFTKRRFLGCTLSLLKKEIKRMLLIHIAFVVVFGIVRG
ncbi:uncharacterized protein LOC108915573 [Anoplophora glabripennis]|uniref:uncharacterized protein LOC108915573 n=1 Tax=Anoplophora glabripennis TaxID=217634 RepID=UPI000C78AF40|nr:uncharacterized protein LOC108915573 [Anoplophora glabripennis]